MKKADRIQKLRLVFLGLGITCTTVALLALAGVNFIVPFLNPIALMGAPLFMLLFALLSIFRRQRTVKRIIIILLAVLCIIVIVVLLNSGLFWLFSAQYNFGKVYPSPSGLYNMVVVDDSFPRAFSNHVYPLYRGCFYLDWQGKWSEAVIDQFRWKNNHTVEVFICNCNTTFDAWWSYNFWTMRWELAEIVRG